MQPAEGSYSTWKERVRDEGRKQCVYCALHEALFGGYRNFHVDHFRPKKRFPTLENSFHNLYYACAICNTFKGSSWPAEPEDDHGKCAFIDPSKHDYSSLMTKHDSGEVSAESVAAKFLIQRLYLNRPQLITARRFAAVAARVGALLDRLDSAKYVLEDVQLREIAGDLLELTRLYASAGRVAPYEPSDVRRKP